MMDDLISRQAAIEAIEEMQMPIMRSMFPEEQFVFKGMSEALSAIKDLSSAQPDSKETSSTHKALDTISRQAAIRWVKTECNPYGKPTLDFESGKKVIEHLKQMPSAQPEIIRCKDCKYFELDHFEKVDEFPIPIICAHEICMKWGDGCRTSIDGWCFMAERKTDG